MSDRKRNQIITTPAGIAKYPRIHQPDTKFKAEGEYSIKLVLSKKDAAPFVAKLKEIHAEAYQDELKNKKKKTLKQAPFPWKNEVNDEGTETGNVEFKAALKAKVTPKKGDPFEQRPAILDAHRKPITSVKVGGGSKVKLAVEVNPWFTDALGFGIQLRLKAVQVLDLVEYTGGGDASGFFEDEDGFTAEEESSDSSDESFSEGEPESEESEDETPAEEPTPASKKGTKKTTTKSTNGDF
jgi:hypothetical protein